MSLDVYLTLPSGERRPRQGHIYVREDGQNREITRAEWDARFPDREPVIVVTGDDSGSDEENEVYSANITHNLNNMADAAGVYDCLWRPDEHGMTKAAQLIEPLRVGLGVLNAEPERFMPLNPSNGWGTYDGLVRFVARYLEACERWPDADVHVSR